MALDFPDAPVIDETFIPVGLNKTFVWDGFAWVAGGSTIAMADAPSDGTYYARLNSTWSHMSLAAIPSLHVEFAARPVAPPIDDVTYNMRNQKWVEAVAPPSGDYVLKTGDTMSGDLHLSSVNPGIRLNKDQGSNFIAAICFSNTGVNEWFIADINGPDDLLFQRVDPADGVLKTAFGIERQTGKLLMQGGGSILGSLGNGLLAYDSPAEHQFRIGGTLKFWIDSSGASLLDASGTKQRIAVKPDVDALLARIATLETRLAALERRR